LWVGFKSIDKINLVDNKFIVSEITKAYYLCEIKRYNESNELLNKLLTYKSKYDKFIFKSIGENNFFLKNYTKALHSTEAALKIDPNYDDAHFLMSKIHHRIKNKAEKHKHIDIAIELSPDNIQYQIKKATYLHDSHQYNKAKEELERLEKIEPENSHLLYALCITYDNLRKREKFNSKVSYALSLYPNNSFFLELLSLKHLREKNYDKAILSAEASLMIDPTNKDAQDKLELGIFGKNKENRDSSYQVFLTFAAILYVILTIMTISDYLN
jgi:tetratricopeptide (TPR) repeat protein